MEKKSSPRPAPPPASNSVLLTVRPTAFPLAWDHSLSLLSLYVCHGKKKKKKDFWSQVTFLWKGGLAMNGDIL